MRLLVEYLDFTTLHNINILLRVRFFCLSENVLLREVGLLFEQQGQL
jgi:hypothetical protein